MLTNAKTRLLFVTGNLIFARLFLRDQIRMLAAEGYQVLLVCAADPGPLMLEQEFGCKVEVIKLARSISLLQDLKSLVELIGIVRSWKPAMVHTHTPKAGLLGAMAAWLERVPVRVHTFHGLRSETLTGNHMRLVQAMERITSASSTHCLAVSCSLRAEIIRRNICEEDKLQVLGAGSCAGVSLDRFNPELFHEKGLALRKAHGIAEDHLLVTFLGRRAKDKGIAVLEHAWSLLRDDHPDARLLIAGPTDLTDQCDPSMMNRLRADRRVILLDKFVHDVATMLAASDLFVQPSFREGLGVAALEASALKVPVIASRVTGLIDAVSPGRTGLLVSKGSGEELADAIVKLLEMPRLRRQMGEEGRRFVEANFDRRLVLARLMLYYRQIIPVMQPTVPAAKRIFDCAVALTLLFLALPLMLLLSLLVLVTMGRPIFFRQQRAGRGGVPFSLFKFRTMRAPKPGEPMFTSDAVRTSQLGNFMRRLSLDELPQLWNVLRGDMSLVGPRPLLVEYLDRYGEFEYRRHEVLPGITGWAQVHGRNNTSWRSRFAKDIWYVNHCSFWLDLIILGKTMSKLLRPVGIVPEGSTSMPEFFGTKADPQS